MKKLMIAGAAIACLPMLAGQSLASESVLSDAALDTVTAGNLIESEPTPAAQQFQAAGGLLGNSPFTSGPPATTPPSNGGSNGGSGGGSGNSLADLIGGLLGVVGTGSFGPAASFVDVIDVAGSATAQDVVVIVGGQTD